MAGGKSTYLEAKVLDVFVGGASFIPPANLYLALFTTGTLTDVSTGSAPVATEVSGASYARLPVSNNFLNWTNAFINNVGQMEKHNIAPLTFSPAGDDWGIITQWAICDAPSGGNIYYYGEFDSSRPVNSGDSPEIQPGSLKIFED